MKSSGSLKNYPSLVRKFNINVNQQFLEELAIYLHNYLINSMDRISSDISVSIDISLIVLFCQKWTPLQIWTGGVHF